MDEKHELIKETTCHVILTLSNGDDQINIKFQFYSWEEAENTVNELSKNDLIAVYGPVRGK